MRGKTVVRHVAIAGLVLATVAAPAAAQAKLEFTPFFGSYYGVQTITDDVDNDGSGFRLKQIPAASLGAQLTYWFTPTIGIEGAGTYSWSGVRLFSPDGGGAGFSLGGNVLLASGRMLYRPPRSNFHLLGGLGFISRSGDIWDLLDQNFGGLGGLSTIGGVLGFGARAAVTPKVALNVGVEAYLYKLDPDTAGTSLFNKTNMQVDVLVKIGVPLALMK
jgi:hypothetical protein